MQLEPGVARQLLSAPVAPALAPAPAPAPAVLDRVLRQAPGIPLLSHGGSVKAKGVKRGSGRSMLSFSAHHAVVGLWQAVAPKVLMKQHSQDERFWHFDLSCAQGVVLCLFSSEKLRSTYGYSKVMYTPLHEELCLLFS